MFPVVPETTYNFNYHVEFEISPQDVDTYNLGYWIDIQYNNDGLATGYNTTLVYNCFNPITGGFGDIRNDSVLDMVTIPIGVTEMTICIKAIDTTGGVNENKYIINNVKFILQLTPTAKV